MMPPEDQAEELAMLLAIAYGGEAAVEVTENGVNIRVRTARGFLRARLENVHSPVLTMMIVQAPVPADEPEHQN